ncbi:MAG TPA: IS5 family transposase [Ktedonobacteraceae bacterium]|nr:IS5 family transposase [Ktedonobacteraceae bacterium]
MKTNQISPSDLTDRQWNGIKDLLPSAKPGGRPRSLNMRAVINGIISLLVSGCQWRLLPREYPAWQCVYTSFQQWRDDGTWQRIHDTLRAQIRRQDGRHEHPTAGALDSQSVKTVQGPGIRGDDAGKHINGRKRHFLVDTMGLLLAVIVTAASVSDPAGAKRLFKHLPGAGKKLRKIWVDGTYRGRLLEWVLLHGRFHLQPVLRCEKDFAVLPRRWVVQRTFAWVTQCRRLGKDDETLPKSSEAMISLAMTRLMIRRLAQT